jgi:hypothetical protein
MRFILAFSLLVGLAAACQQKNTVEVVPDASTVSQDVVAGEVPTASTEVGLNPPTVATPISTAVVAPVVNVDSAVTTAETGKSGSSAVTGVSTTR